MSLQTGWSKDQPFVWNRKYCEDGCFLVYYKQEVQLVFTQNFLNTSYLKKEDIMSETSKIGNEIIRLCNYNSMSESDLRSFEEALTERLKLIRNSSSPKENVKAIDLYHKHSSLSSDHFGLTSLRKIDEFVDRLTSILDCNDPQLVFTQDFLNTSYLKKEDIMSADCVGVTSIKMFADCVGVTSIEKIDRLLDRFIFEKYEDYSLEEIKKFKEAKELLDRFVGKKYEDCSLGEIKELNEVYEFLYGLNSEKYKDSLREIKEREEANEIINKFIGKKYEDCSLEEIKKLEEAYEFLHRLNPVKYKNSLMEIKEMKEAYEFLHRLDPKKYNGKSLREIKEREKLIIIRLCFICCFGFFLFLSILLILTYWQ